MKSLQSTLYPIIRRIRRPLMPPDEPVTSEPAAIAPKIEGGVTEIPDAEKGKPNDEESVSEKHRK